MVAYNTGTTVAVRPRIAWGGVFAGVLAGIVTFVVLAVLGLAVGLLSLAGSGTDALGGLAIGALIYLALITAASAYLAGLTASRAAAFLTPAQGRFNGLLTGMLLLILLSWVTTNLLTRGIAGAFGLAGTVVSAGSGAVNNAGGLEGTLNSLGLGDQYQAIVNGFDREELVDIIAEAEPELSEQQVNAAASVISNVVRNAGQNISGNLGDISNLGDVVGRQVANVERALSGPEFVTRLQRRGLSQPQAQEVATVIQERFAQIRSQTDETIQAVTRTTADVASRAAWIWLLIAALVIGLATFGGGRGGEVEPVETVTDADRTRVSETPRSENR